jgi:aminoglycoside/choline kinase family phosphotransferase
LAGAHPEGLEARVRETVRDALGRDVVSLEWIAAGIGLRRFARVACAGNAEPRSLIARVEAPEDPAGRPEGVPPEPPLEPIRAWLEANALPVPRRFGADRQGEIELLEDLGDTSLAAAARAASPQELRALYERACALVPRLQRVPKRAGVAAFERQLDAALFRYKGELFAEHSLPDATPAARTCIRQAFAHVASLAAAAPQRLAHRDFQSENLRLHDERLVMIDLQGALLAPPEYDLVCLLRDSYVELDAATIDALFDATRAALPDAPDPETARLRFDVLTLTRKGKDHARFLYAARVRGDARYLEHVPTTVRHLHAAATRVAALEPRLGAFAELVLGLPDTPCAR